MPEQIAQIYKASWQIEVFFGWIEQRLNIPISTKLIERIQVFVLAQNLWFLELYAYQQT